MNERNAAPFGHRFQADGSDHFYDAGTNEILRIDPVLAEVLPLSGILPPAEIHARLDGKCGKAEVERALQEIEAARRDEGLFRSRKPRLVPPDPALAEPGTCDARLQHLVLSVTDRCNLRCRYCLHGSAVPGVRPHGRRTMDRGTALAALAYYLDRCDPDARPAVSFYGGEPLLALDLIETVVAAARRHRRGPEVRFAVDTNGLLLQGRALDFVLRERIRLQVSLDGPREIHDRHRRTAAGGGSFGAVCSNLEAMLRRDPSVADRLRFVVTLAPPVDLPAIEAFFARFPPFVRAGIDRAPSVQVNEADLRALAEAPAPDDPASYRSQWFAARERYLAALPDGDPGPVLRGLFEPSLRRLRNRSRSPLAGTFTPGALCRPGRRKLHVTVDGRFQPCERTGDVLALGSVVAGIEPGKVAALQAGFHRDVARACVDCWALRLCRVCFAHQALSAGRGEALAESVCPAIRASIEEDLRLLVRVSGFARRPFASGPG